MDAILNKVKTILGITGNNEDAKIMEYISLFCDKVKSICNRSDFPEELNYMAVEYVRKCYTYYKNKTADSNEKIVVSSASDNGQSVSFNTIETISKSDVDIDNFAKKNADEISMYAYMRW